MGVNNYQTILRIELNDQMCYSEHHVMVPEHFYCWVAGFFKHSYHVVLTQLVGWLVGWLAMLNIRTMFFSHNWLVGNVKHSYHVVLIQLVGWQR